MSKNFDQLPAAGDLGGTETFPVNQAGVTKYSTINAIVTFIASAFEAAGAIAAHLADFAHADIAHTNRTALDAVEGVNTGDQDLSGYATTADLTDYATVTDPDILGQMVIGDPATVRKGWADLSGPITGIMQLGDEQFLMNGLTANNCFTTAPDGLIYLSDGFAMRQVYSKYTGEMYFELYPTGTANTNPASSKIFYFKSTGAAVFPGSLETPKAMINSTGGYMIKLTNKTGAASVKGEVVTVYAATAVDNAVAKTVVDIPTAIGVFYESGIADGAEAWIVVSGIADVYFGGSTTRGNLARTTITGDAFTTAGYAISEAAPTSPFATDKHFMELGHVLESRTGAGLAKVNLHFN